MGKLSNYPNLFLPLASLSISVFLLFMFFSKKNVRNDETKIYSYLVVTGFIESLVYVTVVFLVNLFYDESKFLVKRSFSGLFKKPYNVSSSSRICS